MIMNDWIVAARLNYERGTPFPRYIEPSDLQTRADARGLIRVNAPLLVA